jgi:type IV pilus assembly protein PilC
VFSSHVPLKPLSLFCRSLSTMLHSGVPLVKAFPEAGHRLGDTRFRRTIEDVTRAMKRGTDISTACEEHGRYFPELFIDLVRVAEQTGTLPEVLARLADHYENLLKMRRLFVGAIALPVLQLGAAILIVTFVIWLLGQIATIKGTTPVDILGLGLMGTAGALTFFFGSLAIIAAVVGVYLLLVKGLGQQKALHRFLLRVPVLGDCMQSFAIARFSWSFALTQQAGMSIIPSIDTSLRATSNGAFAGESPRVCSLVKQGEELTTALGETHVFPADYLHMVHVAETGGTVPEMLDRLSPQFEDRAKRGLMGLTVALGWLIWMVVAGIIIFFIFRIAMFYINALQDAARAI